ncbi:MAG TPA: hypothetical protein VN428_04880 [Bryobacteraceae bacterium]|nr:hypothetical protein [Bryobacteraceae bacterium]
MPQLPDPPLGTYTSRCDDKGRVRLPKQLEEYLRVLPDKQFFITTMDGSIGKIYPRSVWEDNRKAFAKNKRLAIEISRYADHYGSLTEIDNQARVLLSPELRRKLGVENQPLYLRYDNEGVEIYSEATQDASLRRAEEIAPTVLPELYELGVV